MAKVKKASETGKKSKKSEVVAAAGTTKPAKGGNSTKTDLPIAQIVMPKNKALIVRTSNGDTSELKRNIRGNDLINPLLVRPVAGGKYELLCGHRRFSVLQELGRKAIAVNVRTDLSDDADAMAVIMSENSEDARTAMSPIEQAKAFTFLLEKHKKDFKAVGNAAGFSHEHVRRTVRLLEAPPTLQKRLDEGSIGADLVIHFQQVAEEGIQKKLKKQIESGEIKTTSQLKAAQAELARDMADDGKSDTKGGKKDGRKQSSSSVVAWRPKGDVKDAFYSLMDAYIATEKEEEKEALRMFLCPLVWVMGLCKEIDVEDKNFLKFVEKEAKRIQTENAAAEEGAAEEDTEEEKPAKNKKSKKKARQAVTAGGGEDDEESGLNGDEPEDDGDDEGGVDADNG